MPGLFFPPAGSRFVGPSGRLPPLVVFCHGGPTSAAEVGFDPVVQFFASRGLAVAAVDYRGSSGYGRAHRRALDGLWGEADVDDCVHYAESLAGIGWVDGDRMAIRGTSAGGLTALGALIRSRRFAGAAVWYGVTDLESLVADTHDFESRYLDSLVGEWPRCAEVYRARSPLHHPDQVSGAVLLLQGEDDPVVPATQSRRFAEQLHRHDIPCRLTVFDGESHGFRRADTIEASLTAELEFYRSVFGEPQMPITGAGLRNLLDCRRCPGGPVVPSTVPTDRMGTRPGDSPPHDGRWMARASSPVRRARHLLAGLSPAWRDAFLYACSALFAGVTGLAVSISLYRQWGQMAFGPYALAAGLMAVVARQARRNGRWSGSGTDAARSAVVARRVRVARVTAFLIVLIGATLAPLSLEVVWRSEGNAAAHVQPEVVVVEQAGDRAAHGRDPYLTVDRGGHILIHQHQEPTYELYYPYLPGMVIFGVATGTGIEAGLTDARIQFLIFTLVITLIALSRLRPPTDARVRAFQVLTVLPTAALPLATGGDDMPVVALMLLGLAALQRRRPVLCGLALGAASSLKFTAWPLALLALWAVRDTQRHRAIGRYLLGAAAVVVPVVFRWRSTTRPRSSTTSSVSRWGWPMCHRRRPAPCPATSWCPSFRGRTSPMWCWSAW